MRPSSCHTRGAVTPGCAACPDLLHLLRAQRGRWIHAARPPCRSRRSRKREDENGRDGDGKRRRVGEFQAVELAPERARDKQPANPPENQTGPEGGSYLARGQLDDIPTAGAHRDPDRDVPRVSADELSERARQAQRREQQYDRGGASGQSENPAPLGDLRCEESREGPRIADAGRAVPKEELMNVVWRDTPVTDNALTRIIAQIRRELGDE